MPINTKINIKPGKEEEKVGLRVDKEAFIFLFILLNLLFWGL